ncbi:MFS transporter [Rhodococcus maanshanensis]|uniref:MFS transporter n=1 Tax=Rhodococcus TaxID=1827 RepID=UPI000BE25F92|nr:MULTISPECIES: MFS transporter [Rhodococcus]MCZ4553961.1 MFS transporter [Rhodococcus maanshanensis]
MSRVCRNVGRASSAVLEFINTPPERARRKHTGLMTLPTPALRAARVSTAVGFGLQGMFLAALLTQLPQFKDRYGFDDSTIVVAVVLVSLVAAVGSVIAEYLATRTSSKTTLRAGLFVIACAGTGIAFAPSPAAFFTGFAVYGVGLGMVDAATNMQAVAIQHRYGRSILSSFHGAWSVGAIVGALYVSACSALEVSLPASIFGAALGVAAGTLLIGPRLLEVGPEAEATTSAAPLTIPMRPFLALGAAMALFFAIDFSVGNWSALYLKDLLLASASTAALAVAAYQTAGLVSRLTGDFWVRRHGEVAVVRVGSAIAALGLVVVIVAQSPTVAIIGFLIVGLGAPVIAPLCFSAAGRLAPPDQTDAVIARLNLFNYAGTLVGGAIVGAVAAVSNLRIGFVLPLLFAVALFLLAPAFRPKRVAAGADSADLTRVVD